MKMQIMVKLSCQLRSRFSFPCFSKPMYEVVHQYFSVVFPANLTRYIFGKKLLPDIYNHDNGKTFY